MNTTGITRTPKKSSLLSAAIVDGFVVAGITLTIYPIINPDYYYVQQWAQSIFGPATLIALALYATFTLLTRTTPGLLVAGVRYKGSGGTQRLINVGCASLIVVAVSSFAFGYSSLVGDFEIYRSFESGGSTGNPLLVLVFLTFIAAAYLVHMLSRKQMIYGKPKTPVLLLTLLAVPALTFFVKTVGDTFGGVLGLVDFVLKSSPNESIFSNDPLLLAVGFSVVLPLMFIVGGDLISRLSGLRPRGRKILGVGLSTIAIIVAVTLESIFAGRLYMQTEELNPFAIYASASLAVSVLMVLVVWPYAQLLERVSKRGRRKRFIISGVCFALFMFLLFGI
jgi:hypothetical protein